MRLDEAVRNLDTTRKLIREFNSECEAREHTDIGDVWDILREAHRAMTDVIESWDN